MVDVRCPDPAAESVLRLLAGQAFSRAGRAPLVPGNGARILRNADEHYPTWLSAIDSARQGVFLENYIFADDAVGREFLAALAAKAREGVRVRVIYDWLGNLGVGRRLFKPLIAAGGEVRRFNAPRLSSPFGWLAGTGLERSSDAERLVAFRLSSAARSGRPGLRMERLDAAREDGRG